MSDFELKYYAEERARSQAEIARHARLLRLAEQNGYCAETCQLDHLDGTWWEVPFQMVSIVGCQMARVS